MPGFSKEPHFQETADLQLSPLMMSTLNHRDTALLRHPNSSVGIFWVIHAPALGIVLLVDRVPLARAELYGNCLTYSSGHYEFWSFLHRLGAGSLAEQGLPAAVLTDEYEEWPRGRVVYDTVRGRFIIYADIYADRKLHSIGAIGRIAATFGIKNGCYLVATDGHYRSTRAFTDVLRVLPWAVVIPVGSRQRRFHVFSAQTPEEIQIEIEAIDRAECN